MGDHARIRAFLSAVRARLRLQQMAVAGALALGVAAAGVVVFLAAAATGQPSLWWRGGFVLLVAAAGTALLVALVRPFLRWRGDEQVARFIGERTGAGDLVLSAVEVWRQLPSLERDPLTGSPALARAHLARVASHLDGIRAGRVAEFRPSRRLLTAAGLIAFVDVMLVAGGVSQARAGWAQLHARPEKSAPKNVTPIVGDIELSLQFPAHTGLPPRAIPGSSGEVLAMPGTEVTIRARPLVASVRGARLEVLDGDEKVLEEPAATMTKDGRLEARFVVRKAGAYRFVLLRGGVRGISGPLREPEPHRVEIDPDRAPKVGLAAPAENLELPGPRRVQLAFSVEDDYGLRDVSLVWRPEGAAGNAASQQEAGPGASPDGGAPAAGGRITGREVVRESIEGRAVSGTWEWDLDAIDLPRGVAVTYWLEARDNDAVSGPNVGVSRSFTLRIDSAEQKHEALLAMEQALADHAVAVLGDRLDAERSASVNADKELDALGAAHSHAQGFLDEAVKIEEALGRDPRAPKDLKPALAGIRQRLGKLLREEEPPLRQAREAEAGEGDVASLRRTLRDGNGRHVAEMEKDALLLADLLGRQRMEQLLAITDEMRDAEGRLKQLLAEYKKTGDPAVRAAIEREIRKLEQKMAELAMKASKLAGEVPDEFVNRQAMGDNDFQKRLDSIRDLLAKGDVDRAMEELKKLSSSLDKMASSMEGDLKSYRNERFSAEEKALGELESKLADLEHDERQLQAESEEMLGKQREEQKKLLRERVEPFLRRAKERVADMKRKLAAVDRRDLPPHDQEPLDNARRRVDDLAGALEQGDLEQAREMARRAGGEMNGLALDLRDEEERRWEGMKQPVRRAREKVEDARSQAEQIVGDLDQMMPRPGEMLGPEGQRRLAELSERQDAIRRRAEDTRREVEKRLREREGMNEGLRQAGEHMQRAQQSLGGGNPRDGAGEASQAADRLSQMRRDLQNERRPRPNEGQGAMNEKEVVKIPGADEYRAPREFRQDLLEAMKREAPSSYREQVKRYYEELVK